MSQNLISAFSVILNTEFVITLFLYLGVILLTTKILGIICRKLGLPQVVGALLAGMLLTYHRFYQSWCKCGNRHSI